MLRNYKWLFAFNLVVFCEIKTMYALRGALWILACCALTSVQAAFSCRKGEVGTSPNCIKDTPYDAGCVFGVEYTIRCDVTCAEKQKNEIWGTTNYTYDSSLCRSALHDRRISSWNTNQRLVSFKRINFDFGKYHNTISQGIESIRYGKIQYNSGYFYFTSPRIKEPLVDLTSLHRRYLYQLNDNSVQECHIPNKGYGSAVQFSYRNPVKEGVPRPEGWTKLTTGTREYFRMRWGIGLKGVYKDEIRNYLPGGVQCRVTQNDLSIVTSMTMRKDAFFAPHGGLTLTVNYGENIDLTMYSLEENPCKPNYGILWRKDAKMFEKFDDFETRNAGVFYHLEYKSVNLGHSGVYSLECNQHNGNIGGVRYDRRGVIRLIVRSCPANLYGDHCNISCPFCQNGGVCHDLLGVCICPPGFNGSNCENPCGPNTFGRDCDKKCSETDVSASDTCIGVLFCLPDPYGCSCATGFKGLDCQTTCDSGYFGAGCAQKRDCHCANNEACDVFTGLCLKGCEEGWKGNACVTSYPILSDKPQLLKSNPKTLELSFDAWDSVRGLGQGTPATYVVEVKDYNVPGSFHEVERIDASNLTSPEIKKVILGGLKPNTEYAVRVIIFDIDGSVQKKNAPTDIFRTSCGKPLEPLHSLSVEKIDSRNVRLSWKRPSSETWQCSNVTIQLSFNSSSRAFDNSTTRDEYLLTSKPYTTWYIRARIVTDNSRKSDWAVFETFATEEDAPSTPQMVRGYFDTQTNSLLVNWTKPADENGVLHSYNVELHHRTFKEQCNFKPPVIRFSVRADVTSAVFNSSQFYYASFYSAAVSAITNKEGPKLYKSIDTPEYIPQAPPRNTQATDIGKDSCIVKWQNPECHLTNGFISQFYFTYQGLDEWEANKTTNMSTRIASSMLSNLTPFTKYRFRVSACTAIGCSDLYDEVPFKTKETNPPKPRELTVFSQTTRSVSLTWKAPYPPNGRIIEYRVNYRKMQQSSSNEHIILALQDVACTGSELRINQSCYTIHNLEYQTSYEIWVTAINHVSQESSQSKHVTAVTEESIPDSPKSVQMENRTTSSIFVSWFEPVRSNGELTSYRINVTLVNQYGLNPIDGNGILSEVLDKERTTYNVTDLEPASTYNVTVEASTSKGYGPPVIGSFVTRNEVPKVNIAPEVGRIGKDSVELIIKPLSDYNGPITAYYVLVKDVTPRKRKRAAVEFHTYNQSQIEYIAAKLDADTVPPEGVNFTVGDGHYYDGFYNAPLENGHSYRFGTAVESKLDGEEQIGFLYFNEDVVVSERSKVTPRTGIIIGTILAVILVFGIFFLILYYKKPELFYAIKGRGGNSFLMKNTKSGLVKETTGSTLSVSDMEPTYDDCLVSNSVKSNLIPVKDLESYAQESNISAKISQEYLSVGKGIIHPCHLGKLADNKSKNRYGNLLPYDHCRVKLEKDDSGDYSDYINASYIENFKGESTFIATQGPKPLTLPDFWRMVWQENTCKVVMVTNIVEGGRIKCEKYWPDTVEKYGKFTISLVETETFADFVIRKLMVSKGESEREIKQFHFTTWPDHGIPAYPIAVITFLKRIRNYNSDSTAPVVVHCSAGVGRTGTIILLANMIEMAKETNTVDPLNGLWTMRQCRVNLVETLEQYIFVYNALSDYLCAGETSLVCPEFRKRINEIIESKDGPSTAERQFERLQRLCTPPKFNDCVAAHDPLHGQKNRVADILPPDRSRAILPVDETDGSDYINAVYINGYKQNNAFIATQLPLPETIKDFWRLVLSTKISSIVLLHEFNQNDSTCPRYWEEGGTQTYGDVVVEHVSTEAQGTTILVRTFSIKGRDLNSEEVTVKQFHLQGWMSTNDTPDIPDSILDLIDKAERWQKHTSAKTLLVQCLNGATGCGVFCASVFTRDKIKTEQEVDVYLAVRNVRANRPQFITNLNQYIFLHKVAIMYLDSFETYANFQ